MSDEDRQRIAEEYGFRKIGKPVPDGVTLGDVQRSLPAEVFEIDNGKAWRAVGLTVAAVSASMALIAVTPWYLLPVSWFIAGTAWTGMFVIGHDCAHRVFSKNKLVEDLVGTIMFAPLVYPYEPWRIKHNVHHAFTNKLVDDTGNPIAALTRCDSPLAPVGVSFSRSAAIDSVDLTGLTPPGLTPSCSPCLTRAGRHFSQPGTL